MVDLVALGISPEYHLEIAKELAYIFLEVDPISKLDRLQEVLLQLPTLFISKVVRTLVVVLVCLKDIEVVVE